MFQMPANQAQVLSILAAGSLDTGLMWVELPRFLLHLQAWPSRQLGTALPSKSTLAVIPARQAYGEETRLCQVMCVSTPRALGIASTCSSAPGETQAELGLSSGLAGTQYTPSP